MQEPQPQLSERGRAAVDGLSAGRGMSFEVTSDLACVPLPIVNLYLFGERGAADRTWVLVDAGLPLSRDHIRLAAAERFGVGSRPSAIVLTHGHFDHVGALPDLAEEWDVPVYAHALERPYLAGESSYPPPDPAVGGGGMSLLSRFYPRGPIDLGARLRLLPADGNVPGMPGWRWVHTPGHAPGHVALFRDADRTLIAGDAFVTTKQESTLGALLKWDSRVRRPPAYYTTDWEAARRSVESLAQLQPEIAATGHGMPRHGEAMRRELQTLVDRWDELAVPAHGRYIGRPAITDEHGVVDVPPPAVDLQLLTLAGIGLGAIVGLWLIRGQDDRSRRS